MKRTLIVLLALVALLSGCTSPAVSSKPDSTPSSSPPPPPPAADVSFAGPTGEVTFDQPVVISATDGKLSEASVVDDNGITLSGTVSPDGLNWTSNTALGAGTTYTWSAKGTNTENKQGESSGTFSTTPVSENEQMRVRTNLGDGWVVGVAAPVTLTFSGDVAPEMRANVESRLKVITPTPLEGSWAWLPNDGNRARIHYRPADFWPENTSVKVEAPLAGVPYGNGEFGMADITVDFQVGRNQVVTADAQTHRMIVTQNGQEVANYPASLGGPTKDKESFNGVHVVTEKHEDKVMRSERFDYETPVKWAVRINNNGEFIHAAPWSVSSQGKRNVSHGCVNISMENAKAYFDGALYGDPVIIQGTSQSLSSSSPDIWDWAVSYDEWKSYSAL